MSKKNRTGQVSWLGALLLDLKLSMGSLSCKSLDTRGLSSFDVAWQMNNECGSVEERSSSWSLRLSRMMDDHPWSLVGTEIHKRGALYAETLQYV
ncbi:hypothetical protein QBC37DRAFT_410971 [Rhypophila decipiens]|uniref:Uncharacterized protein n=1 Tax=Rhypophila decipiens TaxID=261697 RepID=A0AAN6YGP0_9PEZI|nr:hypothetical protein QBC37DRAFT_410971 [Rhypophila decipiens]